jgi:hypothetical protein
VKYVMWVRRLRRRGYVWIDALEDAWFWAYRPN